MANLSQSETSAVATSEASAVATSETSAGAASETSAVATSGTCTSSTLRSRSDQRAYPIQASPKKNVTALTPARMFLTRADSGAITTKPATPEIMSSKPAQRGRIPARIVATPSGMVPTTTIKIATMMKTFNTGGSSPASKFGAWVVNHGITVADIKPKPTPTTSIPKKIKTKPANPSQPAWMAWRAYIPTRPAIIAIEANNITKLVSRKGRLAYWSGLVMGKIRALITVQASPNRLPRSRATPLDRNSVLGDMVNSLLVKVIWSDIPS